MPVAGTPELALDLPGGLGLLASALFLVPGLVALALEAVVLAWSDGADRRTVIAASLVVGALASLAAALSTGPVALGLWLGLWGYAVGIANGSAQAALVASSPDPARAMTRWGLSATAGDVVAPLLLAGVVAMGGSWRVALAASALFPLATALAVATGRPLTAGDPDEDEPREPIGVAVRSALRDRWLLAWLAAAAACTLMDEIVVVLVALRVDAAGVPPLLRAVDLAVLSGGGAVGLALADRALPRVGPRAVLLASAVVVAAAFGGWLLVPSTLLLALTGLGIGPMWPLCTAAAYARRPERPGLVGALNTLFAPADLAAPVLVGLVADRYGLTAALATLLLQPLVVAATALAHREGRGR